MTERSLSIAEFQELIRERYYATDSARGVPGTFMWFIEEVGELATALGENGPDRDPTPEQAANLAEEFGDVLAWLATLANVAEVDLAAAVRKYTEEGGVDGVKP
jgi:NTP pyrophosphatase (non-canonical NTP hydrolase)